MTIEELNKIKENVRRKAEQSAYCRGLEAGRKEQKAKDKYVIECIEEEHHYDIVFLKEKVCDAYCKVCGHFAHTTPTHICRQDCRYYKDFKQAMEEEV